MGEAAHYGPETYTLITPIELTFKSGAGERTEKVTELTIDWPADGVIRAKHLRATDGHHGVLGKNLALLSFFTNTPIKVLDELAEQDLLILVEKVEGFPQPGLQTGETS